MKKFFSKAPTGEYTIRNFIGRSPFTAPGAYAYCDMETDGGGWMIIQKRLPNGKVNFTRNWSDYENGFGDLNGEFWYGLRNIHHLTTRDKVELRIDMVKKANGQKLSWIYQTFQVAGAADKYKLTIGEGEGEGRDAMAVHNGQKFTTYDSDNDLYAPKSCGYIEQGGWWYAACYHANLNGPHTRPSLPGIDPNNAVLEWHDGAKYQALSSVEMKIRVKKCIPC